ncbi:MAG TPA: hypothetical protein PL155_03520 [Candidatus Omnitrophota bacterium]|nr:hypothetical protein [Candidatus Omnitrophota bacterium]HPD84452.1 hypothetical protein [Candidatus Omnitrophota bacterium]HRZ03310.1 hypothetical protein [Candidatus Omnitrophota bacterium]
MKNSDIVFVVLLVASSTVTIGIIGENIRPERTGVTPAVVSRIDSAKIKADIERAGLVIHEAKYWKLIRP